MNIEQYPLLQYIVKKYTYIYNSEGLINFNVIGYYPIFIRTVWDCSYMVIGALRGVGTYDF